MRCGLSGRGRAKPEVMPGEEITAHRNIVLCCPAFEFLHVLTTGWAQLEDRESVTDEVSWNNRARSQLEKLALGGVYNHNNIIVT